MLTQKEINQYINCVKKNYNGPYKIKKRFLDELTQAISEFTSDNPDAARLFQVLCKIKKLI